MSAFRRLPRLLTLGLALVAAASASCRSGSQAPQPGTRDAQLFGTDYPQNYAFKQELAYLETTGSLTRAERDRIESQLAENQKRLGVPRPLLWCLLFQESRLDRFRNADREKGARGLGQFTHHALEEINEDTNHFDARTGPALRVAIQPEALPLTFASGTPEPPRASYFSAPAAVTASAAYLNNRYQQLRRALERQNVSFDPQVLWLYAAAAYNKGTRTIFVLLSHQRMFGREEGLSELLQSPKLSYALLTHKDLLDYSLREIWPNETREKYVDELARNMEMVLSCSIPETVL